MSKPKLFISHSSKDDPLADRLAAALEDRFDVWLDHRQLQAGERWRELLDGILLDCHAALLLMTPDARERPYWVATEASILRFRRQTLEQASCFKTIPLLVDGLSPEELSKAPFDPAELGASQGLALDSQALDVGPIVAELGDVLAEAAARTELRDVERFIAQKLEEAGSQTRPAVGELLGFTETKAEKVAGNLRWMAAKLLRADLDELAAVVVKIAGFGKKSTALELLDNVAPYLWVDRASVLQLRALVAGLEPRRGAGLLSAEPDTPAAYVRRASETIPCWQTWSVNADFDPGGSTYDQLVESLVSQARPILRGTELTSAEGQAKLARYMKIKGPIVVLLPRVLAKLDPQPIDRLVGDFAALTFLLPWHEPSLALDHRFPDLIHLPAPDPAVESAAAEAVYWAQLDLDLEETPP